ncbi:alpha/beta hydrolase fold-3 domain-containing protein [Xylariaceae sp. FL0804]|nr:alpha/beta hydrolase fold-3 domain-containing protein [Xylariaceae sp. FL0804]
MAYTEAAYPGRPLLSYQPLSAVYKLLCLGSVAARLPFWLLKYALARRWRQHPAWTLRQCLMTRVAGALLDMTSNAETPTRLSLEPGREGDRWETIEPAPAQMYRGPLDDADVRPATIGGTWYPRKPPTSTSTTGNDNDDDDDDAVYFLHLHGGAFVFGDGRTGFCQFMASTLARHAGAGAGFADAFVFVPQYRLACRPAPARFPAALQDALTSYLHLTTRGGAHGVPPRRVVLSGDSAGGNLAIALLRYLAEFGAELGVEPPACAVLVAPWVAPARSLWPASVLRAQDSNNPHYATDYLGTAFTRWGAKEYLRGADGSDGGRLLSRAADPYASPLGHAFATPVPLLASFGAAEVLAVDGARWAREMAAVPGNACELSWEPHAPHDTLLCGYQIGFEESAAGVARQAGAFVRRHAAPGRKSK